MLTFLFTFLAFIAWGLVAVAWVGTMFLAAWVVMNFNPDTTRNMPVWKGRCIKALIILPILYSLPLLIITIVIYQIGALIYKLNQS